MKIFSKHIVSGVDEPNTSGTIKSNLPDVFAGPDEARPGLVVNGMGCLQRHGFSMKGHFGGNTMRVRHRELGHGEARLGAVRAVYSVVNFH